MREAQNLIGQKSGKLRVLGLAEGRSKQGYFLWTVQCDCGSPEFKASTAQLHRKKPLKSCGCLNNKRPAGESARHRLLLGYKRNARKHNRSWELTDEQFNQLTQAECHYCGRPPMSVSSGKYTTGSYVYNGIDRKKNEVGYVEGNVVTCCKICNWAKGEMPYDEFTLWIGDLVRYQSQKLTSNLLVRSKTASGV